MKFLGGIVVFCAVVGGVSFLGTLGSSLSAHEIKHLKSLALQPIQQSMSVAQAYRAIPHNRVRYRSSQSVLSKEEAHYLEQAFALVDLAVVERVSQLRRLRQDHTRPLRLDNYEQILKRFLMLPIPPGLGHFHHQVMAAIAEEETYFKSAQDKPLDLPVNSQHPLIQSPHRRLLASYKFLVSEYPQELSSNQQAFYEHLCALDFL